MMSPSNAGNSLDRLWLAISGHGHGHLVQLIPIVRALRARYPDLVLAVQSSLPASLLQQSFGDELEIHDELADFGMVMSGPMNVLPAESLAAYQRFHENWSEHLEAQLALFHEFKPDLVIGDIPYLPLAAAKRYAIPSMAVCSLNWADILEHYCGELEGADEIVEVIRSHYAAADVFLQPEPSMPMATLENTEAIGPLVVVGQSRRGELQQALCLHAAQRLVLLTLGGISGQLDLGQWPVFDDTVFLVPETWLNDVSSPLDVDRYRSIESTELSYADLFASCDAMITKAGYGAFVGAGCCGLPILYAERGDWPEEPWLVSWLQRVGRAESIDWQTLSQGEFQAALDALLQQSPKPAAEANGAAMALEHIETLFR